MPFLDKTGLAHLWEHIVARLNTKADKAEIMQSDWLQTDNTQLDYIKNKPEIVSDEEFFNWIIEEKIVEPIASTNGEIYITNNNEIYVL
jgi:hypothetical protein